MTSPLAKAAEFLNLEERTCNGITTFLSHEMRDPIALVFSYLTSEGVRRLRQCCRTTVCWFEHALFLEVSLPEDLMFWRPSSGFDKPGSGSFFQANFQKCVRRKKPYYQQETDQVERSSSSISKSNHGLLQAAPASVLLGYANEEAKIPFKLCNFTIPLTIKSSICSLEKINEVVVKNKEDGRKSGWSAGATSKKENEGFKLHMGYLPYQFVPVDPLVVRNVNSFTSRWFPDRLVSSCRKIHLEAIRELYKIDGFHFSDMCENLEQLTLQSLPNVRWFQYNFLTGHVGDRTSNLHSLVIRDVTTEGNPSGISTSSLAFAPTRHPGLTEFVLEGLSKQLFNDLVIAVGRGPTYTDRQPVSVFKSRGVKKSGKTKLPKSSPSSDSAVSNDEQEEEKLKRRGQYLKSAALSSCEVTSAVSTPSTVELALEPSSSSSFHSKLENSCVCLKMASSPYTKKKSESQISANNLLVKLSIAETKKRNKIPSSSSESQHQPTAMKTPPIQKKSRVSRSQKETAQKKKMKNKKRSTQELLSDLPPENSDNLDGGLEEVKSRSSWSGLLVLISVLSLVLSLPSLLSPL